MARGVSREDGDVASLGGEHDRGAVFARLCAGPPGHVSACVLGGGEGAPLRTCKRVPDPERAARVGSDERVGGVVPLEHAERSARLIWAELAAFRGRYAREEVRRVHPGVAAAVCAYGYAGVPEVDDPVGVSRGEQAGAVGAERELGTREGPGPLCDDAGWSTSLTGVPEDEHIAVRARRASPIAGHSERSNTLGVAYFGLATACYVLVVSAMESITRALRCRGRTEWERKLQAAQLVQEREQTQQQARGGGNDVALEVGDDEDDADAFGICRIEQGFLELFAVCTQCIIFYEGSPVGCFAETGPYHSNGLERGRWTCLEVFGNGSAGRLGRDTEDEGTESGALRKRRVACTRVNTFYLPRYCTIGIRTQVRMALV